MNIVDRVWLGVVEVEKGLVQVELCILGGVKCDVWTVWTDYLLREGVAKQPDCGGVETKRDVQEARVGADEKCAS